jgi:hypothetical protein
MALRASDTIASVSLFVEILRTRPLALFWGMAALQAVLWTLVPLVFYSAPPGQLPEVLAIGHDFQLGTEYGPPLAFWVAEIVYRGLGLFGVYLLSQLCIVVAYWAVFTLGRGMVGDIQAVMAVLLMAGIAVFSVPTPDFGPAVLATAVWALMLLHYWRAAGHKEWTYWLVLGVEAGVLLLTTYAGAILIGLLVLFMVATPVGRSHLDTVGPWVAGVVAVVIMFPYLIWLDLSGGPVLIDFKTVQANLRAWMVLLALLVVSHLGFVILIVLGRGWIFRSRTRPPEVLREPVDPGARAYVYFFALAPLAGMGLFALITHRTDAFVLTPLVVLSGLAAVIAAGDRIRIEHQYLIGVVWAALLLLPPLLVTVAILVVPWTLAIDLKVGRPAAEMGQFFGESFQRRTGKPLAIVTGERSTAALVAFTAPSRPSLYVADAPVFAPYVKRSDLDEKGAIVVWHTTDATGRPPPEIRQQFPNLVVEVPRAFPRRFQGRMPLQRVGWGMLRPGQAAESQPPQPQPAPAAPLPLPPPMMPEAPPLPAPQAQPPPPAEPPPRPSQRQFQPPPPRDLHAPQ